MKKTKSLRRLLAGVLAALMVLSAIPVAFAVTGPVSETPGELAGGKDTGYWVSFRSNKQYFTFIQTEDDQDFRFQFWLDAKKNAGVNYGWVLTPQSNGDYPQTLTNPIGKSFAVTWDDYIGAMPGNLFGGNSWVGTTITVDFVANGGAIYDTALQVWYDSGSTSGTDRGVRTYDIPLDITVLDKRALNSTIAEAEGIENSGIYTDESWQNFQNALAAAQSVGGNVITDQTTIDQNTNALIGAMADLVAKDADYTALDAAIAAAEAILGEDDVDQNYDADKLATLREAYGAAKAIVPGMDITHQDEITAAATALQSAVDAMVKLADYTKVAQALAAFEKLNPSYYDAEDFAAVQALVEAARESMNNRLPATQQDEVDQMANEILDAMASLVKLPADYAALDALVAEAEELYYNSDNVYTPASITALETALLAAMDVQDADYTIDNQQLVDAAYTALDNAMKAMVKLPADKDVLQTQVDAANAILVRADYNNYTDASREALENALAAAQQILDDDSLTVDDQAKVQAAAENLAAAIRGLALKGADYNALKAAIEARKAELEAAKTATVNDGDKLYTDASITRLSIAIENAESVVALNLPITAQTQVDDAVATLNSVQLEKNPADYSALNALIEEKQTELNNAGDEYTDESKQALQQAINTARTVVAQNYKIDQQELVDNAVAALEAVELALKGADYTALDDAIAAAEKFLADPETAELYTPEAIQAVRDALEAAQSVDRDLPITAQDTVDAAATALNNAVENAKTDYNPAVLTGLNDAIAAAQAKLAAEDIADYTDESIQALEAAIAEANALIAENPDITRQGEVDAMAEKLNGMELTLKPADKSGVQDAIDKGEEILDNREQYTDEYIDAVEEALDNLYEILDEDLTIKEQDKVDGAIDAIDEIAENPSYVGANLDSLNAAISAAEAKKAAPDYMNYTEASRQALEAKLQEAIALRDSNPDITRQAEVDEMAAELNAIELKLEGANYDELDAAIAAANELLADLDALEDKYTLTSIQALQNAVAEAALVERDQDVTYQSVIDAAAKAVRDAIAGLTEYGRLEGVSIVGGDSRDGDMIYKKVSWTKMYKKESATLRLEGLEGVDVASITWEPANWSVDDPEATITVNEDGSATITPNGRGIGARSMWVKVTVTDVNGNVATDIVKVRFYKWNWQK